MPHLRNVDDWGIVFTLICLSFEVFVSCMRLLTAMDQSFAKASHVLGNRVATGLVDLEKVNDVTGKFAKKVQRKY